jgi:cation:H+ antiporter
MLSLWLQYLACGAAITVSGYQLCRQGDIIAARTGLGRTWIGVVLLASATSLPELITGSTAVVWLDLPDLAVGNVFGASLMNLLMLAIADLFHRPGPVLTAAGRGQVLAAALAIIALSVATLGVMARSPLNHVAVGHLGLYTPVLLACYLVGMRILYRFQKREYREYLAGRREEPEVAEGSLAQAVVKFSLHALVVVAAAVWLPRVASDLAIHMNWQQPLMGTIFVALATTLPELVVTLSALKIGAVDLAIGDLFGSVLFNINLLAIFDLLSFPYPVLQRVAPTHAATGLMAILMTAIAAVELVYRPEKKILGWLSAAALLMAFLYACTVVGHFLAGA